MISTISQKEQPVENFRERYTSLAEDEIDLRQFLLVCLYYLPGAILGGAVGVLLGFLVNAMTPKVYQSSAFLEVTESPLQDFVDKSKNIDTQSRNGFTTKLQTHEKIAMTPSVQDLTKERIKGKGSSSSVGLEASIVPSTTLIQLNATSEDKDITKFAADTWADVVLESVNSQAAELYRKGNILLSEPYQQITREIENLEHRINTFKPELEIKEAELTTREELLTDQIQELLNLDPELERTKITLPVLEGELKKLEKIQPELPKDGKSTIVMNGSDKGSSRQNLMGLLAYGVNPNYVELEKKITEQNMVMEISLPRREQLQISIPRLKTEVSTLQNYMNRVTPEIDRLERDLAIAKQRYNNMIGKIGDTETGSLLPTSDLRIASYGGHASAISLLSRFLVAGFLLGGILAILIQFIYKPVPVKSIRTQKFSPQHPKPTEMIS